MCKDGNSIKHMSDKKIAFMEDERAIEGLPIRLVIALVVGVASLALMLNILGGVGQVSQTEVNVAVTSGQTLDLSGGSDVTVEVTSADGEPVENANVLFEPDTAQGDIVEASTGSDGEATVSGFQSSSNVDLRTDQSRGTYDINVLPPGNSSLVDEQENPEIVILDN